MGLITLVPPTLACNKYKEGEGARNGVIMHHRSAGAGGTAALVRPPLLPPPTALSTPSSLFWHGGRGRDALARYSLPGAIILGWGSVML